MDKRSLYANYLKRVVDLCLAAMALFVLSPVLLLIAIILLLRMGRPVFFVQRRGGKGGKVFSLYKFRTMSSVRDEQGDLLPDAARLTRVGSFLRKTSLDELPEIVNILRGEMSFVGPRPLLSKYLALYTPEQMRRHEVRPGMTGWAQVNGRNHLTWEEKFALDVWYVDHLSFGLDLKILFLTVIKMLKQEGISQPGEATMEEFSGSPQ